MKKGKSGAPSDEVRKQHIGFIQVNWDLLATEAFKGYVKTGKRGLLTVKESSITQQPGSKSILFQMAYLAEGSAEFDSVVGPREQLWFTANPYDPEVAMCVTFLRLDDGVSSYNVMGLGDRTPKALYERSVRIP